MFVNSLLYYYTVVTMYIFYKQYIYHNIVILLLFLQSLFLIIAIFYGKFLLDALKRNFERIKFYVTWRKTNEITGTACYQEFRHHTRIHEYI